MSLKPFPKDYFVGTVVRLLDTIKYRDSNYTREQRIDNLHYAYAQAANHFAQPRVQETLKADPKRLEASLRTITGMTVYSWAKVSQQLMADLSTHYTYTLVLDDSTDDPHPQMQTFFDDMVNGRPQTHPWLQLVFEHFPNVLRHFGPYCSMYLIRSTVDFFQGCWVEQYNFHGYEGAHDYPLFLRRLNGLGHCVGGSLWPKDQFDEKKLFTEITSAVAQMENWMVFVNDLLSFYKEYDDPRDQTSLIMNYCKTYNLTVDEGLEKLTQDTLHSCEQMMAVFSDKDPQLMETIESFMHGYVTWHLCDPRYRLPEIYAEVTGESEVEAKFRKYCEQAYAVGSIEPSEWAYPSISDIIEQNKKEEELKVEKATDVVEKLVPQTDSVEVVH
ncbi:hypothetical protein BBP40_010468 [Aspergillus hancockii]|nr:hypothetical protein BBP40_010468 [Aspergillus hancockii]